MGREGGIVRIVSVLAVMGEDLRRVPPLLSRLQADWMPEFAEALSCISAADRFIPLQTWWLIFIALSRMSVLSGAGLF